MGDPYDRLIARWRHHAVQLREAAKRHYQQVGMADSGRRLDDAAETYERVACELEEVAHDQAALQRYRQAQQRQEV